MTCQPRHEAAGADEHWHDGGHGRPVGRHDCRRPLLSDHYFTAEPASAADTRPLRVQLNGRLLELRTARGVFSHDRLDQGTAVLLDQAPAAPAAGMLLDLGCGWGPIALSLALRSPSASVVAVDVNERALDLLRANASSLALANITVSRPGDVPAGTRFAAIYSNPPIRVGKAALRDLLMRWLPRLEPGASAYLVVQRNLGSDSLQAWLHTELGPAGYQVSRLASAKGFRLLHVVAPPER